MADLIDQIWQPELAAAQGLLLYVMVFFLIGSLIALGALIYLIQKSRF